MKFISITEHFGFCYERLGASQPHNFYVIYRIKNGNPTNVVTTREKRKDAVKECKYLEKLNAPKFRARMKGGEE